MESVPESTRTLPRARHNLAEIGWDASPDQPATLDFVMSDYVRHLEHHLRQILGEALDGPAEATRRGAAERAVPMLPADDIRVARDFYAAKLGFRVTFDTSEGARNGMLESPAPAILRLAFGDPLPAESVVLDVRSSQELQFLGEFAE